SVVPAPVSASVFLCSSFKAYTREAGAGSGAALSDDLLADSVTMSCCDELSEATSPPPGAARPATRAASGLRCRICDLYARAPDSVRADCQSSSLAGMARDGVAG